MAYIVNLSQKITSSAYLASKKYNRTISEQTEHWIRIGKLAEDNPDLPYAVIKAILDARQEIVDGKIEMVGENFYRDLKK